MKKIIFILSIALTSCDDEYNQTSPEFIQDGKFINSVYVNKNQKRELYIYEVDGCEYIGWIKCGYSDVITHKGNCKNPIHKK